MLAVSTRYHQPPATRLRRSVLFSLGSMAAAFLDSVIFSPVPHPVLYPSFEMFKGLRACEGLQGSVLARRPSPLPAATEAAKAPSSPALVVLGCGAPSASARLLRGWSTAADSARHSTGQSPGEVQKLAMPRTPSLVCPVPLCCRAPPRVRLGHTSSGPLPAIPSLQMPQNLQCPQAAHLQMGEGHPVLHQLASICPQGAAGMGPVYVTAGKEGIP